MHEFLAELLKIKFQRAIDEVCDLASSRMKKHRVGLEPTSPHYGCGVFAAKTTSAYFDWDQTDLNRHLLG